MLEVGVTVKEESRRQCRGEVAWWWPKLADTVLPQRATSPHFISRPHPRPVPRETTRLRLVMCKSFYSKATVVSYRFLFHIFTPILHTMTADISTDHPALSSVPVWVREKLSTKAVDTIIRVHDWVENECIPAESIVKQQIEQDKKAGQWKTPALIAELRTRARREGLWNLFLPKSFGELSPGLTNLEYSCCAEIMGRCYWAAQVRRLHA